MALRAEREPERDREQPVREFVSKIFSGLQPGAQEVAKTGEDSHTNFNVREMNVGDNREAQPYVNFLLSRENRVHFANPPRTPNELRRIAKTSSNHFLVALALEKDSRGRDFRKVVGGALIEDAAPNQHDHFISLVVVDPNKKGHQLGTKLTLQTIEWGFSTSAHDGRPRKKLDLAIIMGVEPPEAETIKVISPLTGKAYHTRFRMEAIAIKLGFSMVSNLPRQVDVPGFSERKATRRYELELDTWKSLLAKPEFKAYIDLLKAA